MSVFKGLIHKIKRTDTARESIAVSISACPFIFKNKPLQTDKTFLITRYENRWAAHQVIKNTDSRHVKFPVSKQKRINTNIRVFGATNMGFSQPPTSGKLLYLSHRKRIDFNCNIQFLQNQSMVTRKKYR